MNRLLLDTHVFLWWRTNDRRLRAAARRSIADAETVYVSLASAWEAAIKASLGRLKLQASFQQGIRDSDFEALPIAFEHVDIVASLPHHHRDPFDRLLIAQARAERLTLVTHDTWLQAYDIQLLQA